MPVRSLEEIRAAAKAGKSENGAKGSVQKPATNGNGANGHDMALAVRKESPSPMQTPLPVVPRASSKHKSSQLVATNGAAKSEKQVTAKSGISLPPPIPAAEENGNGSRASTPETLPEEPPAAYGQEQGETIEFDLSVNHSKLLILVSKYAQCALTADDHESWIRQVPLYVMIYEGIVAGVIEFDYAPASVLLSFEGASRRLFMNVSQEGKAAIDDLREQKMINGLKLSSEDFQPITSYQVSLKGLQFLKTLPNSLYEEVNSFVYAPNAPHYDSELLVVSFQDGTFFLHTKSGFSRESDVADVEDVSYVSSPFLPDSLRTRHGKPMTPNAHRAHEAMEGGTNIKRDLDEAIHISYCTVLVGEWIPFGANNIVALNERLGAFDRCQGGLFTSLVDKCPTDTNFKVPAGLTEIKIVDFDLVRFINFEAEINFPEEEGLVQIEHFGMHMNVDGTIFYGMKIEAIVDHGAAEVSLDLLSRVLVDVQLDSSKIMDDLLTGYQRSLLEVMFLGDASNRNKYNMIVADSIHPKMQAQKYIDRGTYENELKQVLGELFMAHDIGADDLLIVGKDGVLLAGPNAIILEPLVLYYVSLLCREVFIRTYFMRIFVLVDTLKKIRQLILRYETDPDNVNRVRMAISEASKDLILLQETLSYLQESLDEVQPPEMPQDAKCKRLFRVLNCQVMSDNVRLRVRDLAKLVDGAANQLTNLTETTDAINSKQLEESFKNVESNTKFLVDASTANERASASLAVMQVVLAGSFAFDIIDRIGGATLNIGPPLWVIDYIVVPLLDPPGIWFALNMVWMAVVCYSLTRLMRNLEKSALGALILRVKLNKKIKSEDGLLAYLSIKIIDSTDSITDAKQSLKKVLWAEHDKEKWLGSNPVVELTYDDRFMFLISVTMSIDSKTSNATEEDLLNIFLQDLVMAEALDRVEAFGGDTDEGEVERALAISKMQSSSSKGNGLLRRNKTETADT